MEDNKKQVGTGDRQKSIIRGSVCGLLLEIEGKPLLTSHNNNNRNPPILFILRIIFTTRRSGDGFHSTFYLDCPEYNCVTGPGYMSS